jgi:hypothetical protein
MTSPGSNRRVYKEIRERVLIEVYLQRREGLIRPVRQEDIRARVEELHQWEFAPYRLNVDDLVGALMFVLSSQAKDEQERILAAVAAIRKDGLHELQATTLRLAPRPADRPPWSGPVRMLVHRQCRLQ